MSSTVDTEGPWYSLVKDDTFVPVSVPDDVLL